MIIQILISESGEFMRSSSRSSTSSMPLFLVLLCIAFISACSNPAPAPCTDALGCVDISPGAPVKLGVIQSLSGDTAVLGQEQIRGLELALDRRGNALLGREVKLQIEDTGCVAEGGANAALKIVADPQVLAIFGTTCSSDAASAAAIMSKSGLVMISGNNSASYLTSNRGRKASKWQGGYFRTAPNEESAGPAAARHAFNMGLRKAALIDDGEIYTKGLTSGFQEEFTRLGGSIVLDASITPSDPNMGPGLSAVRNAGAELIFFPLFQPDGNNLLLQARSTPDIENVVLMSDGSLIDASFLSAVGNAAKGLCFVGPTPPSKTPETDRLASEYKTRFGSQPPTIYYVSAFDAAGILFDALEKTAKSLPDGTLRIGRQALREAMYATRDFKGVSSPMTCNEFGDCAAQSFDVLRLDEPALGLEGLKRNVVFTFSPES